MKNLIKYPKHNKTLSPGIPFFSFKKESMTTSFHQVMVIHSSPNLKTQAKTSFRFMTYLRFPKGTIAFSDGVP